MGGVITHTPTGASMRHQKTGMNSGGAGYVLNANALTKLRDALALSFSGKEKQEEKEQQEEEEEHKIVPGCDHSADEQSSADDLYVAQCLSGLGIFPINTQSEDGARFHLCELDDTII